MALQLGALRDALLDAGASPAKAEAGVYVITCIPTGKSYVGSAVDIRKRWKGHRSDLRAGKHSSQVFQRAWDKYGEQAFQFRVIELVPAQRTILIEREQAWIDTFGCVGFDRGFNVAPKAYSPLGIKRSAETRAKITAAKTGKKRPPVSVEFRARMSALLVGNTRMVGKTIPPNVRAKMAVAQSGKRYALGFKHGPAFRAKISASLMGNKRSLGKSPGPETRAKLSAALIGKKKSAETRARMSLARRARGRVNLG